MGVDCSFVFYVGKQFDDSQEAREFYERFFELSNEDENYIEEDGFAEFCYGLENDLDGVTLNCYSGWGFVLGIDIGAGIHDPERFSELVSDAITKWKSIFKDEAFEIIHTVRVW